MKNLIGLINLLPKILRCSQGDGMIYRRFFDKASEGQKFFLLDKGRKPRSSGGFTKKS